MSSEDVTAPCLDTQVEHPAIIHQETTTPPPLTFNNEPQWLRRRKQLQADEESGQSKGDPEGDSGVGYEEDEEPWEEELQERTQAKGEIRGWKALRDQLKKDLEAKYKTRTLPLSKVHQLMILHLFANLMVKGYKNIPVSLEIVNQWHEAQEPSPHFARRIRALARHYEIFEQLPIEHRGGSKNARSLLKDEGV